MTEPPRRPHRRRIPPIEPPPRLYWTDVRVRHRAHDAQAADADVAALIEAAERLGFDLELVKTRPHAPRDPLPD
jgi:hypothetical protein